MENVSREDDFFELGGHSLYIVRLIGKLTEYFNVRLSVPALFQAPTIRELATLIETRLSDPQFTQARKEPEYEEGAL